MALYREEATGFIQDHPSNPGAGYTPLSAQPTDSITNRVNWWRGIDAYGQASTWHPSLTGTPEFPGTDTSAGRGINILPSDYASFEWAGASPPTFVQNATVSRSTSAKYHGIYGMRFTSTIAGGTVWCAVDSSKYNIDISPNGKWIVSAYVRPTSNVARTVQLKLITSAGTTYTVSGDTLADSSSWKRISGVFDLTSDASTTARIGFACTTPNVQVDIDAIMLEEKIGPFDNASAFYSPWGNGIVTEQYPDYGIPQTKLYQDLGTRIDLIDAADYIPGSVNARIKTTKDSLDAAIAANGSAIISLQSVDATQSTLITALGTRVGTAESTIINLQNTTAGQATSITQLTARTTNAESSIINLNTVTANQATSLQSLGTRVGSAESSIVTLNQTTANQANSITQLNSTVNGNSASIQTQATAIAGLQAQYSVKLDVNGYVAGFGIWNNGAGDSGFLVRADKFAIGFPGTSNKIPFFVDSSGVYMYDAFIKSVTADKIKSGTIGADTITLGSSSSVIQSSNYVAGSSGFRIRGTGDAEFYNVVIRGTLNAYDISSGILSIDRLQDGSITGVKIRDAEISSAKIASLSADKIETGTLTSKTIYVNGGGIQSTNWVNGATGWRIDGAGNADFNTVMVRTKNVDSGAISSVNAGVTTFFSGVSYAGMGYTDVWIYTVPSVSAGTRGKIVLEGVVQFFIMANTTLNYGGNFPQFDVVCGISGGNTIGFTEYPYAPYVSPPNSQPEMQQFFCIPFSFIDDSLNTGSRTFTVRVRGEANFQWLGTFKLTELKR